jgi:deoxyribonuclease V
MKIYDEHAWDLEYGEAREIQAMLSDKVRLAPLPLSMIRFVAGADVAVSKAKGSLFGAVVVFEFPSLRPIESRCAVTPLAFPYIPGLLSFREIPSLVECLQKIESDIDVIVCDGQGIAHPRGLGLASHLGVLLRKPTIGCAKTRLVGEHETPGAKRGDFTPLHYRGLQVGSVLRTQDGVKPLFVSPGNLVDLASSRRVVLRCTTRFRLPEPTRHADRLAGAGKTALEWITGVSR